jgi:hypothetical protein
VFRNGFIETEPEDHHFSIEPIQCDPKFRIKIFLPLMSGIGCRIPDFKRHDGQGRENEKMMDFPLFVRPDIITAILKYLLMKGYSVAVDPVIVLDDKEKL